VLIEDRPSAFSGRVATDAAGAYWRSILIAVFRFFLAPGRALCGEKYESNGVPGPIPREETKAYRSAGNLPPANGIRSKHIGYRMAGKEGNTEGVPSQRR